MAHHVRRDAPPAQKEPLVPTSPVTFYLPKLTDPSRFDDIDPDLDWTPFRSARGQSIPHTYVRLRQAGHDVEISNQVPSAGIVVVFAGDMRRFRATRPGHGRGRMIVVCVQTDRRVPEVSLADVIVQHNGLRADDRRRYFIPNWPQPGLVSRDQARGSTVRTISYKGDLANLDRRFLTENWVRGLTERGLTFGIDAAVEEHDPRLAAVRGAIRIGSPREWSNYRDTDVILAVRPPRRDGYRHKPAVKLVNAWRAGVPALLGPERAYQELRRSELDYLEVTSPTAAIEALERITADDSLYLEFIANGHRRARDYSVESITARWESLLFESLRHQPPPRLLRTAASLSVPPRRVGRGVGRRASVLTRRWD